MKFVVSTSSPPIGAILTWSHIPKHNNISFEWGKETALQVSSRLIIDGPNDISRYFASLPSEVTTNKLNALQKTEVDQWLSFSVGPLSSSQKIQDAIRHLDTVLATSTYLVGSNISIADLTVFGTLFSSQNFAKLDLWGAQNVKRWYNHINCCAQVKEALQLLPQDAVKTKPEVKRNEMKEEGKFVELPGAEKGKVVVRFPPEASGYLHIGHAKAALLNWYYKELFDGILIMRFDDTNPDKEKVDFEKVILEDLKLLEIYPDKFTHTSEYFPLMLELCEGLLRSGMAYVDDTPPEQMKNEREARHPSRNRDNTTEKNFSMWTEMINGSEYGQKCCVRAKINMASDNGCMRDPTIYRCKNEPHPRTKSLYKVYPTYDFACPIVDSVEGVTHALRTMEYHDRDDQYYWFIDALKLRKPYIWEYSRLNMMNTVLSKRKLTWFVEQGLVESWEDPRFPTVRGVLRRGMTVKGLKQFIIAQGSSRSVVQMEWDKIWAFNKKVIDPVAPRYTALEAGTTVPVNVEGAKEDSLTVAKHPKNSEIGTKVISVSSRILIAADDAQVLKEQENATFINWGNLLITKLHRDSCGLVKEVDAKLNLNNSDFKKTSKLTWLADVSGLTQIQVLYYDHIISKPVLGKDEDFKLYINKDSKKSVEYVGDAELKTLKVGDTIQLQRIGYFRVDISASAGRPLVLIHIPDGSSKPPVASGGTRATDNEPLTDKEIENIAFQWRVDRQNRLPDNPKGSRQTDQVQQLKVHNTSKPEVVTSPESALATDIAASIESEGNKVRQLKSSKASKADIDAAVKILLALKQEYKAKTGKEWKPGASPVPEQTATPLGSDLSDKIQIQGDQVRQLKSNKASKDEIDAAVRILLALKQEFKAKTGQEWKPSASPVLPKPTVPGQSATPLGSDLSDKIQIQGDQVRQLKSNKASKDEIDAAVKILLALKQEFKAKTGQEWKPNVPTSTPPVTAQSFSHLSDKIQLQGDKVRQLKSAKAPKPDIDAAVKILLELKQEYKSIAGEEWKPKPATSASVVVPSNGSSNSLSDKITEQGNLVRQLKSNKASKPDIDAAVKVLVSLKSDFQAATGQEWKPGSSAAPLPPKVVVQSESSTKINVHKPSQTPGQLSDQITQQGNLVRQLKSQKGNKSEIDEAVKTLLTLKLNYKNITGFDWQPTPIMSTDVENQLASPSDSPANDNDISNRIIAQGDRVRDLKASKADKATIENEVKVLLALKTEFKNKNGQEWKPPGGAASRKPSEKKQNDKKPKQEKKDKEKSVEEDDEKGSLKKQTRLCLEARKEENLSDWYSQVITKGELIEYYDVSGCYILRPWAFAVWEAIQSFLDKEIKKLGVVNAYFPMFVSKSVLEREKAHIADFAPEVAWVTKSGESDLAEPIAIRPTSETAMYPAYAKWIKSYRDLPLRLNQWNNVVRWEFKHPQPFLRTREFLWQEGHTAFATYKEAEDEVYQILELYKQVYSDLLAIPVVKGRKTEKEKFAGGDFTTTVEAFISASGRGIQGATSHHLGHNFSKMFDITVEHPETNEKMYVFQNSWGITTRTIGVMIMVHADNKGLVLPPAVAALQVVIVPCGITASLPEAVRINTINLCKKVDDELRSIGLRSKLDERENYSPGWKFNDWELKGVPLRLELGPKDLEKNQVVAVRRDNGNKSTIPLIRAAGEIKILLNNIQAALYASAEKDLKDHTKLVTKWDDFCSQLDSKNIILSPFCEDIHCEENIKKDSARDGDLDPGAPAMGAKSLCIPFEQPAEIKPGDKCIHPSCSKPAKSYTLFGRSY